MALFDKLMGNGEVKMPIHAMLAALQEWAEGEITRQNVIDFLQLETSDEADLDWMKARYDAATDKEHLLIVMHRTLLLGEVERHWRNSTTYTGTHIDYDVKATFIARMNALAP